MTPADLAPVAALERESYVFPWSDQIFADCLRVGYHCVVVDTAAGVAGYGVLSMGAGEAHVLNLCVADEFRRHGIGRELLENVCRSINIALVNELKMTFDRMGIDVWEVIDAAKTKPFGFMPFYPGPGLGGHCIPIDPFYLSWKARAYGFEARFIELAGHVNGHMPEHAVDLVAQSLNRRGRAFKGARVLVLGVAYKAGIDDIRESPSLDIMEMLARPWARTCPGTIRS